MNTAREYELLDLIRNIRGEVGRMITNQPLNALPELQSLISTARWPEVDIEELETKYILTANLPGFEPQDIDIQFTNGELTLKGKSATTTRREEQNFICTERSTGAFARTFPLSNVRDDAKIAAHYANGILTIDIPKSKPTVAQKIAIEVTEQTDTPQQTATTQTAAHTTTRRQTHKGKVKPAANQTTVQAKATNTTKNAGTKKPTIRGYVKPVNTENEWNIE